MNLLFCGDKSAGDGMMIAVASILKNTNDTLHIFILTMKMSTEERQFEPLPSRTAEYLDSYVKMKNPENTVTRIDLTAMFLGELPEANMETRFTPYCMLRLFIDQIQEIPDRILYLDSDVICRQNIDGFYNQDMEEYDVAGVLDYYGSWFFRRRFYRRDYLNSGVLLINVAKIRQDGLFRNCRARCRTKRMFMPDQSAINKLSKNKKTCSRCYNEQRKLHQNTVIQHFSTSFRFFPRVRVMTVKPWEIDRVHSELKLFEYDDILNEYKNMKEEAEGGL